MIENANVQPTTTQPTTSDIFTDVYHTYRIEGHIGLVEIALVIAVILPTLTTIGMGIITNSRLNKTTVKNVISFIRRDDIETTREVENILHELLALSKCDRIVIGVFHNGTKIGKIHKNLMTVFYETRANGIASIKDTVVNIPVELIYDQIINCLDNPLEFIKYSRVDKDLPLKCIEHLDTIRVAEGWERILINKKNEAYAILQFQWINPPTENLKLNVERMDQIQTVFNRLKNTLEKILIKKGL